MKIVLVGGGTGGHFYPLIAVAQAMRNISIHKRILEPKLFYIAPTPYDEQALFENNITYIKSPAGKIRRYASFGNIFSPFITFFGILYSCVALLRIYPDVVFSKGGYASVPTVIAAWILGIPIMIHESDSKPGRANLLASRFAMFIAVSFESSIPFFSKKAQSVIARTGVPVREALVKPLPKYDASGLALDQSVPTLLILGGSSGSVPINEIVLSGLNELVSCANVIHQTGKDNFNEVVSTSKVITKDNTHKERYHPFAYFSEESMRSMAGVSTLIISRAGATSITEISLWHKPSILIPIPESISHDQRTNAYAYAHTGAAVVIEEANMTSHILVSEVQRILSDKALYAHMEAQSMTFANPQAAYIIAAQILGIGLSHDEGNTSANGMSAPTR
jgi:UDP-N-acetylglucosamine--N-acetylmuramyl-(pentapeptide) pyrophosphoryl-undecaprenol N-acetylglucosamine transferase